MANADPPVYEDVSVVMLVLRACPDMHGETVDR